MEKILICILSLFGIILLIGFSKANCNFGKWGGSCQYNCSTTCYYGNECTSNDGNCGCEQLHGNCYGCAKNYFGDVCNKACNQNCSLSDQCVLSGLACGCARQLGYCTSCPKTLWGNYCDRSCSIRCINFECDRTSGQCTSGCTKGYYGSDCSSTCPITCQFGCDQQTSTCFPSYCVNCNGGLPKCDQSNRKCLNGCIDGFYGPSCDKTCSVVTNDTFCTKCQALISIGITVCTECQPEYYYEGINGNCKTCSTGCKSNNTNIAKCFPDTGNCRFGCSAGWSGPRCDSFTCSLANCESCVANQPTVCERCQTGWYLDSGKCVKCSDNCATLNSCDTISGTCTGGCKTGWYGNTCKDNCTANCNKGECDNNGICSSGCNSKRYGQKCDLQCPNCLTTCNRNTGLCDAGCVDGYHGNDCLQPCNSNCLNNKCSQVDSKCFSGCKQGFYGEFCQLPCGSNCDGNSCNPTTGACSGNCLSGKYGDYCDLDCSANCSPRTCIKVGGACTSDCVAGYYGSHCSRTCPSSCSTNQCNKADGTCSGNCPNMKFGTRCELSCSSNCKGTSCDRSSGRCIGGCKAGYYGDSCEKICTGCDNSGCDQTTAVCIGTTIEDDTEVDIAIVIGATIGGAVVLLIIMIIVCCHCLRNKDRHDRKNGSDDVLTPHSDESLEGIDNHQFGYDEIKKDDWVMRNTIRYDTSKQNGTLKPRGGEADAHTDYYDFPPPPPEQTVADINSISFTTEGLPPPPLTVHFSDFDGREGIQVEMLPQYVEYMLHKDNAFESEYDGLPHGLKHQYDVALRPGNKRKNRYKNIYAYDHSRVVLQPEVIDSEDGSSYTTVDNSDYINASYFDGYQDPRAYIACQGPTDEMVDDFWRMVWQLRIQNIVMLTNLIELGQIKCKKYWPDENKTERFGNIYVKFDYQETFADFILTNLIVTKIDPENTNAIDDQTTTEDNARLQVKHLQFTSWPDRDVPKYVTTLVEFHSKVNSLRHEGPLLVHCSAGVGRTGTFIGIDYLMDQADSEGRVNIYKCVEKMRIARPNMVQTPDQYVFLHQALAEALLTSESPVDEDEFENYYNQMQIKDPRSGLTRLQNEFEEVKTQRVKRSHEAAKAEENKHRNRHTNILASDECRVFLWSKIKGCTDYINAIYLPSFRNKYCFIATEMPQCSTIVDFCRMIFQEEVRTIVMLDNDTSGITVNEHYWPEANQTMEMGPFSINVTEVKEHNDYTLRSLNFKFAVDPESKSEMLTVLDQKGTYKVNQFHYKRWSEGKVTPVSVESFVDFINAVTEWQSDSVKHPIIVHCMNGATKVGLFCLVRACMDRLQSDGDVSVVHALHHMRARRSKLVPNYEQYKFCHDCLLRHLNSDHL
ncbi:receptor-type tyrosine-protein phosphatase mu-like isoform X14 [Mytilus edulis]|uniref:receptor-type tyrosine-protein phosphatase mu-like isoform X14 n=1 Tax=Mytilus edulis TaxID=6550 RepID=UPI0039F11482